jgi:hypothetical protein
VVKSTEQRSPSGGLGPLRDRQMLQGLVPPMVPHHPDIVMSAAGPARA